MDPPAFVDFSFQTGEVSRPLSAFVRVENSFRLSFSVEARADSGGNWLNAALSSAGTGNSFNVVVDPSLLAPGTYTGTVLVTSTEGGSTLELPVKVTIWSSATIPLTLKVGDSQTETGATIAIK